MAIYIRNKVINKLIYSNIIYYLFIITNINLLISW
jgi:hypothetical protein